MLSGTEMLLAQVTLAPSLLFVNSKSGVASLYVTNNSALPQEVSISFAFGYPDADKEGNATMNYNDTVAAKKYSLNAMVRVYPRSFLLAPQQQQTVRLQVRASSAAKDAFYFTRVKITSNQKSADVERKVTDSITTQINFKFDQILPVFYRKGNVSTGLAIHDVNTAVKEKKLTVVADVERTGTAPFIGSVKAELFSRTNERVAVSEATAAIYFRVKNKLELDISKAGKGEHRLMLTFETKRSDVAKEDLLQAPPVTKEMTVDIQ
jgi:P pilus assembly chaperone PapD